MKKRSDVIYIADSYSLNTGDIGILLATINAIRESNPHTIIHVEASHPDMLTEYNLDCRVFPRVFDISRIVGVPTTKLNVLKYSLLGMYDSGTFLLFALASRLHAKFAARLVRPSRRAQAQAIGEATLLLSSGGGFLSSHYNPELRFYIYSLALIMHKPYVIFAQSVGPFFGKMHTALGRYFLNHAAAISIREDDSYRYAQTLGLKKAAILTADIAFLLPRGVAPVIKHQAKNLVAFCIKKSGHGYIETLQSSLHDLADSGYHIALVAQTPADDALVAALHAELPRATTVIPFGLDPRKIKGLYARCDFVVSSRMHALIFAAEQLVPWVGIGYEPKFQGLAEQLEGSGVLLDESSLSPTSLRAAIDQVSQARSAAERAQAKRAITKLTNQARKNIAMLHDCLEHAKVGG